MPELSTTPFSAECDTRRAADVISLITLSMQVANAAAIAEIQSNAHPLRTDGRMYWDSRPMLDSNVVGPQEMKHLATVIHFALSSGLVALHPQRPYLLTFETLTPPPAAEAPL